MKTYVQFYTMSTGYIPGSLPPKFSDNFKKPTELLGSWGFFILDGRNNLETMINDAEHRKNQLNDHAIIGYKIIKSRSLLEEGRVLYATENVK